MPSGDVVSLPNAVNVAPRGTKPSDLASANKRLEMAMEGHLIQHRIDGWVREHKFHPTRKWCFDFAFVEQKVAVEIDGLVHSGQGGHQTVAGILADAEKAEAAQALGWIIYRVPGPWLADRPAQVIDTLRVLLAR